METQRIFGWPISDDPPLVEATSYTGQTQNQRGRWSTHHQGTAYRINRQKNILVHAAKQVNKSNALMDRGANGGVAGGNMQPISWTNRMVDLNGVDEHTVRELRIGTFGAVTESQCGPIIAIFPQMAYIPEGKTIISCPQVEHYKTPSTRNPPMSQGRHLVSRHWRGTESPSRYAMAYLTSKCNLTPTRSGRTYPGYNSLAKRTGILPY